MKRAYHDLMDKIQVPGGLNDRVLRAARQEETGPKRVAEGRRRPILRAAVCAVWLHGRAGDLAEQELTAYGMTPEDTVNHLPAAIREILE